MRELWIPCGVILAIGLVVGVSTSRGDADEPARADAPTETMPFKGSETPMKSPFAPYAVGPSEAIWTYDDLTAQEKTVADRGKHVDYAPVHDGYKAAVRQRSQRARATAAVRQLGIDTLDTGVVP